MTNDAEIICTTFFAISGIRILLLRVSHSLCQDPNVIVGKLVLGIEKMNEVRTVIILGWKGKEGKQYSSRLSFWPTNDIP